MPLQEPTRRERSESENELVDFPASGHPLELHNDVAWNTYCPNFASVVLPALHGGQGWVTNLTVDGSISTFQAFNPNPTSITTQASGGNLTLNWPSDHTSRQLQVQTNAPGAGISTNRSNVSGSTSANQWIAPIAITNSSVFYRLALP